MAKFHNAKVGLAVITFSIGSILTFGFSEGGASAAILANNSKLCVSLTKDLNNLEHVKNAHQATSATSALSKLAKQAPSPVKRLLNLLTGEMKSVIKAGDHASTVQASDMKNQATELGYQMISLCPRK